MPCDMHSDVERTLGKLEANQENMKREFTEFRSEVRERLDLLPMQVATAVKNKSGSKPPKDDDGATSEYRKAWLTIILMILGSVLGYNHRSAILGTEEPKPTAHQVQPK